MRLLFKTCVLLTVAFLIASTPAPALASGAASVDAASPSPHAPSVAQVETTSTPAEAVAAKILFVVVDTGVVMLVLSFALCLMRVWRGPTLIDRGIATDTISLHVVGLAILLTISLRTLLYFDAVLIFAILGFATTVAFAQFIGRRRAV